MLQTLTHEIPTAWHTPVPTGARSAVLNVAHHMVGLELFDQPTWLAKTNRILAELMSLPVSWDGANSGPISRHLATYVRAVLKSVMKPSSPLPSFVPTHAGGLQLEWHQQGVDIELMVYRPLDAELSVAYHDGREPIEELLLSVDFRKLSEVLSNLD